MNHSKYLLEDISGLMKANILPDFGCYNGAFNGKTSQNSFAPTVYIGLIILYF